MSSNLWPPAPFGKPFNEKLFFLLLYKYFCRTCTQIDLWQYRKRILTEKVSGHAENQFLLAGGGSTPDPLIGYMSPKKFIFLSPPLASGRLPSTCTNLYLNYMTELYELYDRTIWIIWPTTPTLTRYEYNPAFQICTNEICNLVLKLNSPLKNCGNRW